MENFKGQIDSDLDSVIDMVNEVMEFASQEKQNDVSNKKRNNLKAQGCQVICMCFWYNPDLTMEVLMEKNLGILIADITNCLPLFTSDFEKERALFALVGLL